MLIDIDSKEGFDQNLNFLSEIGLGPTAIIETSMGYHLPYLSKERLGQGRLDDLTALERLIKVALNPYLKAKVKDFDKGGVFLYTRISESIMLTNRYWNLE